MKNDWSAQITDGHHAYLIAGNYEETLPGLLSFLEKDWKIETTGNSDFVVHHYQTLYIENFRDLEKETQTKPLPGCKRIFVISFGFMTRETANAMLKFFEEPIIGVTFFVITPTPERLPGTLRSRFSELKNSRDSSAAIRNEAEQFFQMNLGKRFEHSKKFAGDITDEKRTRADALAFLEAIEEIIGEKIKLNSKTVSIFEELEKYRSYMKDQASSVKLLFDSLAMMVEEIKFCLVDIPATSGRRGILSAPNK